MDDSPPHRRRQSKFTRKFDGIPAKISVRIDPFTKQKIERYAKRRGLEISELVRSWLDPIIAALPDDEPDDS